MYMSSRTKRYSHCTPQKRIIIIVKSFIRFDQSSSKFVCAIIRETSFVLDGKKFEKDP